MVVLRCVDVTVYCCGVVYDVVDGGGVSGGGVW